MEKNDLTSEIMERAEHEIERTFDRIMPQLLSITAIMLNDDEREGEVDGKV